MGYPVINFFQRKFKISDLVRLLFSYTRYLGSSVIEGGEDQWSLSSSLLAFNFLVSLIISLLVCIFYTRKEMLYHDSYELIKFIFLFEIMLVFASRIVNSISQILHIEQIRLIMRSFKSLEDIFSNFDSTPFVFDGPPMFSFIARNLIILFRISLQLFQAKFDLISIAQTFLSFYLPFVMNIDVFRICVIIYFIQVNLSHLSSYVETLKDCKNEKMKEASIEYCCKGYNEMCSQVDRLNIVYGLHLLIVFINIFTVLVDELYHLIFLKFSDRIDVNIVQVLYLSSSLTFTLLFTFSITCACDRTVAKAKQFNALLYQVMISEKTSVISKNTKMRLHTSMKREIVFTAYGFFSLDYSLVHSIAAAATTYLVLLIQFTKPTPA